MTAGLKAYPEMKHSGVKWLAGVPEHWEVLPNRALFDEVKDRDHPHEQMLSVTIKHGVIRQATLLEDTSKKDSSNLDRSNYKLVWRGDIVYNKMRAWQGAVGVSDHRGIVSPAYVVQRPRPGLDPRYLHYLLRTPAFAKEAERWSYGITSDMWSLRPEHFKMIYTCVPPLGEQTAIVRYLDYIERRVRRYIRAKQRLIELLEEQNQAIIHRAVTRGLDPKVPLKPSGTEWLGDVPEHWEVRRLRATTQMRVSNVDKHTKEEETPVRLCNYVDVYNNDYISQKIDFMRATATSEEIERFRLACGDVLITKDSEMWDDIGVPALVTQPANDLISGYHLALLRPFTGVLDGRYLFRALQSRAVAYQFHVGAKGVTRYGLSHDDIESVWLPLPPFPEQLAIVEYVDKANAGIDTAVDRARRQIGLVREYRTRLVADVVTGKLDAREAAANPAEEADKARAFHGPEGLSAVHRHTNRVEELDQSHADTS
jgi:type I restriction enzyme S subunit